MTKQEIVRMVSGELNTTDTEVAEIVDATLTAIGDSLAGGAGAIDLHPLGRFVLAQEPEHAGTDPNTHVPITIAARAVVRFHPSVALKAQVNQVAPTPSSTPGL